MDYDLLQARLIISSLQSALDHSEAQVRALELVAASANQRLAAATERADRFEAQALRFQLEMMTLAAQASAGAMQPYRDVSP